MKALLLAAGKATRLGALSKSTPKCLHRVGDEVLLDRVIRQLKDAGVTEFLINTHHLADQVAGHVEARPDRECITLSHEIELLGTLGTIRANLGFFRGESGWVLHADNFIEGSLVPLAQAYEIRSSESWGTMLTFDAEDPAACGIEVSDERGMLTGFYEKAADPPGTRASAATFVFAPHVFDFVRHQPSAATDISRDLVPALVGRVATFHQAGAVVDIGTPRGLARARELALEGR